MVRTLVGRGPGRWGLARPRVATTPGPNLLPRPSQLRRGRPRRCRRPWAVEGSIGRATLPRIPRRVAGVAAAGAVPQWGRGPRVVRRKKTPSAVAAAGIPRVSTASFAGRSSAKTAMILKTRGVLCPGAEGEAAGIRRALAVLGTRSVMPRPSGPAEKGWRWLIGVARKLGRLSCVPRPAISGVAPVMRRRTQTSAPRTQEWPRRLPRGRRRRGPLPCRSRIGSRNASNVACVIALRRLRPAPRVGGGAAAIAWKGISGRMAVRGSLNVGPVGGVRKWLVADGTLVKLSLREGPSLGPGPEECPVPVRVRPFLRTSPIAVGVWLNLTRTPAA